MKKIEKRILVVFIVIFTVISGIYIGNNVSAARKIKLNKITLTMKAGTKYKLKLLNAKKKVTWMSVDKSIAKVNSKGVVTAVKKGKTTIIAKSNKVMYTCSVNVKKGAAPKPTVKPTSTPKPTVKPDITPSPTVRPTKKPVNVPDNTLGSGERMVKIGMSESDVVSSLGNPSRKDVSPFGFDSYVYKNSDGSDYLLVDMKDGKVVNVCGLSDRIAYGKAVTGNMTGADLAADTSWKSYSWYNATDNSNNSVGKGAYTKNIGNVRLLVFVDFFADKQNVYCIQAFDSSYSLNYMTKPALANCKFSDETMKDMASEIYDMTNAYRNVHYQSSLERLTALDKCTAGYSRTLAESGQDSPSARSSSELMNVMWKNDLDPLYVAEYSYSGCPDAIGFTNSLILQEGSCAHLLGNVSSEFGNEFDKFDYVGISCSYKKTAKLYKVYLVQDFCSKD